MGQVTLAVWSGGGIYLNPSTSQTLRWWIGRRVQTIKPTTSGLTMTLQDASEYPGLPWGPMAMAVINPEDSGFSWTLRDQLPTFSFSVNIGRLVWLSRVRDGAGGVVWWPWLRTIK